MNIWYKYDDDKNHIPIDTMEHARWMMEMESKGIDWRRVAIDHVDNVMISTVFLGLDHSYYGGGLPVLYETMIFGGEYDGYQNRYHTWSEAEEAHNKLVTLLKEGKDIE